MSSSLSSNDSSLSSNHSSSGDDDHITKDKKYQTIPATGSADEATNQCDGDGGGHSAMTTRRESWMKPTASSCMVVSTLTATGVFSASFSVPGVSDD
ncbi:hypothetical protein JHK82_042952 [Glycine max]|nr:hypothetical protein JHK82_042952 [Glycine max]